ncbi:hypothetical protein FSP39_015223 [Pinctada imbricata]|uniref:Mitochondrial inner membrane protease subunit 2 n=1 Tax=Pinctada imbricata TaxID=66713 RepID=A0AA88YN98_PINIB|nr:hypothetical protein FSP39_015223 [Pinctada imbricata]
MICSLTEGEEGAGEGERRDGRGEERGGRRLEKRAGGRYKGWVGGERSPVNADKTLVKRIVGLEGDTVRAVNYNPKRVKQEFNKIPIGHCWVEGDNRKHSLDSNDFGPIPIGLIVGKATHIVWPFNRCCRMKSVELNSDRVQKAIT